MPSVTSMSCSDARSTCEYDFTASTSVEMRAVDSFISAEQSARRERARHPLEPGFERSGVEDAGGASHHSTSTPAAASAGAMRHASSTPWASSQVDERLFAVGERDGSATARTARSRVGVRRARRTVSAVSDCSARPTSDESSVSHVSCNASTARAVADAGLLISWASPAASSPSAISDSRWRDIVSIRRTVWKKPSIRWTPNGNHARASSPSAVEGTRSMRPEPAPRAVAR